MLFSPQLKPKVKRLTKLISTADEYACRMDTIDSIRRRNFALILALPAVTKLAKEQDRARLFDLSASMWSQLKRPAYRIGDEIARKIERGAGLPNGWMDRDQTEREDTVKILGGEARRSSQNEQLERVMLDAAEAWVRFEEASGIAFQPVRRLERLMELARMIHDNGGSLHPEAARQIVEAARNRTQGDR